MKKLSDLIRDGNISTKIKFKLMDIVEMRENNWIPLTRRVPLLTTLDQVTIGLPLFFRNKLASHRFVLKLQLRKKERI